MPKNHHSIDMHSCVFVDPQIQLGEAFKNDDLNEFRIALDKGAIATLPDNQERTVFETALQTHGRSDFVEECLRHGCSPNFINQHKKAAINFAADSCDPKILRTLLKYKDVNVNKKFAELTPLNSLAKNITFENVNDAIACIKILLEYGASVNTPDHRMTPILYILKNGKIEENKKRELVQLFLAQTNIDLDSYRRGEARKILSKLYPELELPPIRTNIDFEYLLRDLQNCDEGTFLDHYREYRLNISETDNLHNLLQEQSVQLLFKCIRLGLHIVFDEILQAAININTAYDGNTAIQIAAIWGNWRALKKLLRYKELNIRKQDKLLITVVRKLDYSPTYDFTDYQKCFDLLLDSGLININETDEFGLTALHYAVHDRNVNAQKELLKRGAYIGNKSAFGELPIHGMQPDILEEHFDNCITTNGLKCGDTNFEIIMNFKNLFPPLDNAVPTPYLSGEMAPIAFFADSKEHLDLLKHPLITSYLFLKWHRLSIVFYVNFFLYTLFAISIVTYTLLKFRESEREVLTSFFGLLSWLGIIYIVLREVIQFVLSPKKYFFSIINCMEIMLIILSIMTCIETTFDEEAQRVIAVLTMLMVSIEFCLLVGSLPVLSISTHMLMLRAVSKSFLKSFTLYSIFVITFSLCFYILIGKPDVDNNNQLETKLGNKTVNAEDEDGKFNKFPTPLMAVIKTIVMLTGEFDAGDIELETVYSLLFFLLFVLFMSIVLFNLLNGLAVSDTQVIRQQAELNGSICRANLLSRYEKVLTGRTGRTTFFVRHEPFRTICSRLMNLYPTMLDSTKIAILPNDNNKIMVPIANSYEMQNLNAKSMTTTNGIRNTNSNTFLPLADNDNDNEKQIKLLDSPLHILPCCCSCISGKCSTMDSRTVKLAMLVIEEKRNTQKQQRRIQDTESRLLNIEAKLNQVFELLKELHEK